MNGGRRYGPSASVSQVIRIKTKEARVFPPRDPSAILINSRIISCKHSDILAVRLPVDVAALASRFGKRRCFDVQIS